MQPAKSNSAQAVLPARYYALLAELIGGQGTNLKLLLQRAGLDIATLANPDGMLCLSQVDALIAGAVKSSGREDLGFLLGRLIKPSSHQFLGYALMTSATLDDALRLAARYWRLITPTFSLRYEREGRGVRIDLEPALNMRPLTQRFHIETIATAFHEELSFLLSGKVPAYDLYLPESLANERKRYRQLAPARVHFVAQRKPGLQLVLPPDVISRPLALADRNAMKVARLRCDEELSRLTTKGSLVEWLTLMLDEANDHQPRQAELARMLHISTRTMNRRLLTEGASFRELGNKTRHAKACRILLESTLPITRIALQLGYQDAANFTRAFRREQGLSPVAYRQKHKSGL